MRLYRCPWCGEEVIDSVRKIWSGPVLSHCPNCHHDLEVRKLPTDLNIIYFFMVAWFLLLTWVSAFILPVFCIIFLFCIFAVISFFGTYILILTRDRNAKSYVSFSATLKFLPIKSGGYLSKKLRFRDGCILGARFETEDSQFKQETLATLFDDISFDGKLAECKCGFVLHDKISEDFLRKGMRFTVIDNRKTVAVGIVTGGYFERLKR